MAVSVTKKGPVRGVGTKSTGGLQARPHTLSNSEMPIAASQIPKCSPRNDSRGVREVPVSLAEWASTTSIRGNIASTTEKPARLVGAACVSGGKCMVG